MADKKLPTRAENFSERYNELVERAGLAEKSDVRGCMVIKPHGYALRENIQHLLDTFFKRTGHVNAYFPLLIPKSYLSKEASHVEGFAKECAVVTHYRLKMSEDGKEVIVDPEAKLEEELIIRPTSETIIRRTYQNRIHSYRDLPLLINQWANVLRREMRTRVFLRTAEFLRQEGHTAHATAEEAKEETYQILRVYQEMMEIFLAISAVPGRKSDSERFAGAVETTTIEAMMQDGKALQSCTSHFLGQNFAKAFEVTFLNKQNETEYVRATSRGMSTRIIGGIIMSHSDDKGLVLPPYIAPLHVVIVPIFKTPEELAEMTSYIDSLVEQLADLQLDVSTAFGSVTLPIKVIVDTDDQKSPGRKFAERELKGVPVRITVGRREMEQGVVEVSRRDTGEKLMVESGKLKIEIAELLHAIQHNLFEKNKQFRETHTFSVDTREEFQTKVEQGFVSAHRDGTEETEAKIKELTGATIRCLPFDQPDEAGLCVLTGKPSAKRVLFAKAY